MSVSRTFRISPSVAYADSIFRKEDSVPLMRACWMGGMVNCHDSSSQTTQAAVFMQGHLHVVVLGYSAAKETGGKRLGPDKAKSLFDNGALHMKNNATQYSVFCLDSFSTHPLFYSMVNSAKPVHTNTHTRRSPAPFP